MLAGMTTVGKASIQFEADIGDVSDALVAKMDEALRKIDRILNRLPGSAQDSGRQAGDALADGVERGAKAAGDGMERHVSTGARGAQQATERAASAASSSLGQISDRAAQVGQQTTANMTSGMRGVSTAAENASRSAASALGGVSTSAQRAATGASSAFSGLGSRVSSVMGQAAASAASAAGNIRTHLTNSFNTAEQAALRIPGAVRNIGLALVAVAGPAAMLRGGFNRLMDIQRAEIGFKNIGLTAEQTAEQMDKLSDQVTGTSLSLSDAAKYSAMFAQSGVEMGAPMDDTIKAFANLAAAAQGTGTDVGVVLQQISAAGKLMGGDAMQLQQAGINIYNYVAEYMGKSVDEVKKLGAEGKITFEDVVGSINAGMGEYAKEMGETLPAKISNFKTAISNLGATIIEPFIPGMTAAVEFGITITKSAVAPLKDLIGWFEAGSAPAQVLAGALQALGVGLLFAFSPGLVGMIMAARGALVQFGTAVWAATGPVGLVIGAIAALVAGFVLLWNRSEAFRGFWVGLWENIKTAVQPALDAFSLVQDAWGELTDALRGGDSGYGALGDLIGMERAQWVMDTITTVQGAWGELTAALTGGDEGYGALGELIGMDRAEWVMDTITTVQAAWGELTAAFQGGDDGYGALAQLIGADAAEWAVNALGAVQTAWDELTAAFSGGDDGYGALSQIFGEQGAEWVVNAVAMVGDGLRDLWDTLVTLGQVVMDLGASLGGTVWETAKSLFASLVEVGQALFGAFWNIAQAVWGLVQALAPVLLPILKVVAVVIGATLFAAINLVIAAFRVIAAVVNVAANVISWLASNVLAPLIGVLGRVAAVLVGALAGALSTVVDWVGKVIGFVGEMGAKIIGVFSGAGTWLWDAGVSIVQGLMNGIKSLAGTIGSFFLDLLPGWIRGPFEKALGIASPSRVFAGYGVNIGEGLVAGMQGMQGQVASAATGLADAAATAAAAQVPAVTPQAATGAVSAPAAPVDMPLGDLGASLAATAADTMDPMWAQQGAQVAQFATDTLTATQGVVVPAWQGMAATLAATQAGVLAPTMQAVQNGTAAMAQQFPTQVRGTITPALNQLGSAMWNVKATGVDPVFAGIRSGLSVTADAFGTGVNAMNAHMNRLRAGAADPVRFTMNTVFSDGLVEMWNSVSAMIGTKTMAKRYAAFAGGGVLNRAPYSPGRDNMRFVDPVHGSVLDLSGHEAVMRPEFTRALGEDRINEINAAARNGGVQGVGRYMEHFAFSRGGVFPGAGRYLGGFRPGGVIYGGGVRTTPITNSHAAWVGRHFPDMFTLTSALRYTDSGHHSRGQATDWQARDGQFATQNPTPWSKALARGLYATFPTAAELIHYPLSGWRNHQHGRAMDFGAATNNQHRNHVHFATLGPIGGGAAGLDSVPINWDVDWGAMMNEWVAPDVQRIEGALAARSFPGAFGGVPQGTYTALKKPMMDTMTAAMKASMTAAGGGDVNRWRPLAMQALKRHGYNPADHIDAMMKQIQIESNGDPGAINMWDSNALRGTPSGGLLQVIEPTYRRVRAAYPEAFRGLPNDHMFPATNLTAGVGAVRMDWGGPAGRWPTRDGYEHGGLMGEGQGLFHKTAFAPERVLSPRQTASFENLVAWLGHLPQPVVSRHGGGTGGAYAGGMTRQVHVTQNIHTADPQAAADAVEDRLTDLLV